MACLSHIFKEIGCKYQLKFLDVCNDLECQVDFLKKAILMFIKKRKMHPEHIKIPKYYGRY